MHDQIHLMDLIEEQISNLQPQNIILGGDFNVILDPNLDRPLRVGRTVPADGSAYRARIESLNDSLELIDIWRTLHPSTRQYSFRRGNYGSRLDYWMVSSHLLGTGTKSDITPYPLSDHSTITVSIGPPKNDRGPGLWRFDASLLKQPEYVDLIKDFLHGQEGNEEGLSPMSHWEWIKFNIKSKTIQYAKKRRREMNQLESSLKRQYEQATLEADQGTLHDMDRLKSLERELREIHLEKSCAHHGEGKTQLDFVGGEALQIFLLNLQKIRDKNRTVSLLVTEDKRTITDARDILAEQRRFYEALYSQPPPPRGYFLQQTWDWKLKTSRVSQNATKLD